MRRPASQSAGRANPINTQEAQINGHRASRGRSLSALFAPPSANKLRPERSGAKLNMIHWRKAPISAPARRPRGAQSGWGRRACSSSWPELRPGDLARLGSARLERSGQTGAIVIEVRRVHLRGRRLPLPTRTSQPASHPDPSRSAHLLPRPSVLIGRH